MRIMQCLNALTIFLAEINKYIIILMMIIIMDINNRYKILINAHGKMPNY